MGVFVNYYAIMFSSHSMFYSGDNQKVWVGNWREV